MSEYYLECKKQAMDLLEEIKVKASEGDDEVAHACEDDLKEYALKEIRRGFLNTDQCIEISSIALSSNDIEFSRWYA